jgi:hypothetical protein
MCQNSDEDHRELDNDPAYQEWLDAFTRWYIEPPEQGKDDD